MASTGTAVTTASASKSVVSSVSASLKKAVDWKIFELQSGLISEDADEELLKESLLWLQARHYNEIIEERVNDGRCGYPLCNNALSALQNAAYRIDYAEKKVFSVETSKNYCCTACIEKAQLMEKKFDPSVPYSRAVAKKIDLTAPLQTGIDDVLNLLSPGPAKSTPSKQEHVSYSQDLPPPPYSSEVLDGTGNMEVRFENGLPVRCVSADTAPATRSAAAAGLDALTLSSSPARGALRTAAMLATGGDNDVDMAVSHDWDGEASAAVAEEVSATRKEVFLSGSSVAPAPAEAALGASVQPASTPARTAATGAGPPSGSSAPGAAGPSMAEMFAQMNALREKHQLDKVTTAPAPRSSSASGNKFTNGSLLPATGGAPAAKSPNSKDTAPSGEPLTITRTGTMGRRPGPKSVRWGENSAQEAVEASAATKGPAAIAEAKAPAPPAAMKPVAVVEKPAVAVKPIVPPKQSSCAALGQRHGMVVERSNPTVMSAAAMMRKREVEEHEAPSPSAAAPASKFARGVGSNGTAGGMSATDAELVERAGRLYISGSGEGRAGLPTGATVDDDGDHWVDVDPSELLLPAAESASAMSIEGYIATVKKTIRVSPATTIKNLSHSPYATETDRGAGADGLIGTEDDEGDAMEDGGSEQGEEWGDDGQSDTWESEAGEDSPLPTDTAQQGRSLFLIIWSTLDELFGGSTDNLFDLSANSGAQRQPVPAPAEQSTALTTVPAPGPEDQDGPSPSPSRPPIALEQQSAQHAFLKLLQRGLHSAEAELDLLQQYLKLHDERTVYHTVKRRLLSNAASMLQRHSNSQQFGQDSGARAGAGLQTAGWTLIGLLLIDAIVTRLHIGPLRREGGSTGGFAAKAPAQAGRDVAQQAWGEQIEALAAAVLRNGSVRGAAGLREGDLHVLRSFFSYM